ncbi:N-acetylglucosaminidase [Paucisalibacillus globulus]|uniref:N-acetylglucosaminidase n=1 Tax=Paucisalibacillus globulus TaxID=351095 RepID=UPI000BB768A1|nr:N-acetylglucosaminidase [Paucisalibacillus globulus]
MQQKKYFFSFIALIMLLTQVIQPSISFAQVVDNQEDVYNIYKATEEIAVDETITILQGTEFFGVQHGESIKLQFKDSTVSIPINLVELSENEIEFAEQLSNDNSLILEKDSNLYQDNAAKVKIVEETTYPTYQNEDGQDVLLLGNVEFYLKEVVKDIETANEETVIDETANEETVIDETANEETVIDETANEEAEFEVTDQQSESSETSIINEESSSKTENNLQLSEQNTLKARANIAVVSEKNPWENVTSNYFKVVTDELVVYDNRGGPLQPVGKLINGQVYPIVSDYGNWHRIQFGNIYGYVKKDGTLPNDGSSLKNENDGFKHSDRTFKANQDVTVFDNTSGSLVPYGIIDKGTNFPIATDFGNWWRIVYADRVGYVRKSEVETQFTEADRFFRADTNTVVYDNRGSGPLKPVGQLVKGQIYPRVSDYGNWHKIQFGDFYGFVSKKETSIATGDNLKNINKNYSNQKRKFIVNEDLPVYDNTSGKLVQFGTINAGQIFPVASDSTNWWRIIYSDRVGYIRKSDVQTLTVDTDKYFEALENLPIYDNRSGSLKKVGELVKGQAYPIESNYGNWWKVNFGSIYGYVNKADTGYATKKQIPNLNTNFTHSNKSFKANNTVTVYDNTTGKLIPFGQLEKGTIFPIATDFGNWWRIIYLDRVGYIKKSEVDAYGMNYTNYNISVKDAATKQMVVSPQTDIYNGAVYVHWKAFDSINLNTKKAVLSSGWNVRSGPGTQYHKLYLTKSNMNVTLYDSEIYRDRNGDAWRRITRNSLPTWINAPYEDVVYYMNPDNFINDDIQKFQFLDLSYYTGVSVNELNELLSGKGVLDGKGEMFAKAAKSAGINEIYLVSHALLESGNGTSTLAKGVKVNGKTVYNFFGINAFDSCPIECGSKKAYDEGWFTMEDAIIGGAQFAKNDYIYSGQNTLYKMRWNPAPLVNGLPTHQYATDIGWAKKQVYYYTRFYSKGNYSLFFDIPNYK